MFLCGKKNLRVCVTVGKIIATLIFGGFQIHRAKGWKEIAALLGIVSPNPNTAYTLKKQYIKFLLPFEARYERGGVDPQSIIEAAEAAPPIKPPSSRNRDRSGESKNKRPRSRS